MRISAVVVTLGLALLTSACGPEKKLSLNHGDAGRFSFTAERSYWKGAPLDLYGNLQFPEGASGKVPAMVILHGSQGQGYRDHTWSNFFLENGVATFQVDWLSPRGMSRGGPDAPRNPNDLISAVKFLSTHPRIDPTRIGTIGFSRGGSIMMASLQFPASDFGGHKPALNVNLYGNCIIGVNKNTTDAPILLIVGDMDRLASLPACETLETEGARFKKDIRLHVMPGGTHAFDDNKGGTVYWRGKAITISPNPGLAEQSRQIVLKAIKETF